MTPARRFPLAGPPQRRPRDEAVDAAADLLRPLGAVRTRAMFGGHGVYVDELFIAIVLDGQLYLKADAEAAARLAAAGSQPLRHAAAGRTVTLGFWAAPAEAMESPALMRPWAVLAMQAALTARARPRRAAAPSRPPASAPG